MTRYAVSIVMTKESFPTQTQIANYLTTWTEKNEEEAIGKAIKHSMEECPGFNVAIVLAAPINKP
jgi:kynureninase